MSLLPLLNHSDPYPDETLASWFRRLAQQNYIDPSILLRLLGSHTGLQLTGLRPRALNWLRDEVVLRGLAQLTRASIKELYNHTFHPFAARLMSPVQSLDEVSFPLDGCLTFWPLRPHRDFISPKASWCPLCLAEAQYVRQHWHVPMSVSCDIHKCWLLEKCPACENRMKDEDLLSGRCGTCAFRLAETLPVAIPDGDLLRQMQATLMSCLQGQPPDRQLGLPDVPPAVLLAVWVGLRYAAQRAGNGWPFHHIPEGIPVPDLDIVKMRLLTLHERACLYATGFRGLLDWPQGFFSYLDAYRQRPQPGKDLTGLQREFGVLHMSWFKRFWKDPAFDFIQQAFNDYLLTHVPAHHVAMSLRVHDYPELLEQVEYVKLPVAQKQFGITAPMADRLAREGHLTIHYFGQSDGRWMLRSDLVQLQERWNSYLTTLETGTLLGVGGDTTRALVADGLVRSVPKNTGTKFRAQRYVYRDSVLELIQSLKQHTIIQPFDEDAGMYLSEVSVHGGGAGFGSPELLRLVCLGRLSAYHPDETLFPLSDLWFAPEVVEDFIKIAKEAQGLMSLTETQHCLGVKRVTVQHYVDTNQLQPVYAYGPKQFFRRQDVLAVRDYSLLPEEAALILNTGTGYIMSLALQGILPVMSGPGIKHGNTRYRFDQRQLMLWREKYVLLGELRKLFGSTGLQIALKANYLKPVNKSPQVYRRKEVMPILEKHFSRL